MNEAHAADCLPRSECSCELAALKSRVAALLRKIESDQDGRCPVCQQDVDQAWARPRPHVVDCELVALLRESEK